MSELVGWKAIAAHLGVSVRTAQRYERTLAMPVTRLTQVGRGEEVTAQAEAIDAWLARTATRRQAEGGHEAGEPVRPAGDPFESGTIVGLPDPLVPSPQNAMGRQSQWPWTRDAVWACLVVAAACGGYGMARFGAPRVPRVAPIVAAGSPRSNVVGDVRGQLVGRIAVDDNGNGEWDSGEEFVAEPGRACPHTQLVSGIVVRWEGADQFGSTSAMNCNPEPFYHARLVRGRYRVTLEVPPSWRITSVPMAEVDIEPGRDTHLWFSVRKRGSAPMSPGGER